MFCESYGGRSEKNSNLIASAFCLSMTSFPRPLFPVNQTAGGAVLDLSQPSCVFISVAASQRTAADTETVWMDAVDVRRAGRAPPVTLWCVSLPPAAPTASALPVSVEQCGSISLLCYYFILLLQQFMLLP